MREALDGYVREYPMGEAEWYAELFARLGFEEQHVRQQVYLHRLAGPEEVVEWVKGSLLTDYRNAARRGRITRRTWRTTRQRLLAELPDERPYLYPFKRLLLWGRRGKGAPGRANA